VNDVDHRDPLARGNAFKIATKSRSVARGMGGGEAAEAKVGETVRIHFGVGGLNFTASTSSLKCPAHTC
jgi:hypothetical protein